MQQQHSADSLLRPLQTRDTDWDPASVKVHGGVTPMSSSEWHRKLTSAATDSLELLQQVSLNVALDGCIVPSTTGGARVDYARLVSDMAGAGVCLCLCCGHVNMGLCSSSSSSSSTRTSTSGPS
jgi:hypothetical protein